MLIGMLSDRLPHLWPWLQSASSLFLVAERTHSTQDTPRRELKKTAKQHKNDESSCRSKLGRSPLTDPTMSSNNTTNTAAEAADESSPGLQILLHQTSNPTAPKLALTLPTSSTPNELRRLASDATTIPFDALRLIYRGKIIPAKDEGDVVAEYKLEDGCVVHCLGKATGAATATTGAASTTAANNISASRRPVGASVIPPPAAAAAFASSPTTAAATETPLQAALRTLRTSPTSTPETYTTALTTLSKLLTNIADHPTDGKYRKIKRSNAAFQKRLGGLDGGPELMAAVGFGAETIEGVEHYALVASAEAWTKLTESRTVVEAALGEATRSSGGVGGGMGGSGVNANVSPFGSSMPPTGAGMGAGMGGMPAGLGGMGGMGMGMGMGGGDMSAMMNSPQMQAAAAQMMSNPESIRSMLSNPMARQMLESDPRFRGNPMARQALDRLVDDPQALQQMSQMMADPNMRQMMMNMGGQQGMGGAGGTASGSSGTAGIGAGAGATAPPNPAQLAEQMRLMQQMMGTVGGVGGGGMAPTAGANAPANTAGGQQQQSSNSNNSSGGNNEDEMTEEEMIQEAIRRSLGEN